MGIHLPPSPKKEHSSPQSSARVYCDQTAGWIKMPLGTEIGLGQGDIVLDGDQALPSPERRAAAPQLSADVYCGQTVGWIKMLLGTEVGLGQGPIVLDGNPSPPRKGAQQPPPTFRPMSIVVKRSPISETVEHLSILFARMSCRYERWFSFSISKDMRESKIEKHGRVS